MFNIDYIEIGRKSCAVIDSLFIVIINIIYY